MKLIIALLLIIPVCLFSQKITEKTFDLPSTNEVDLNLKFADEISITKSTDGKVHFKASVEINKGELNDKHIIDIKANDYMIDIDTDFEKDIWDKNGTVTISDSDDEDCHYYINGDCKHFCYKITYEIKLPESTYLHLETINGDIEIKDVQCKMNIKSISGFIDLSWGNKGADLRVETITGEIYSNLEMDRGKDYSNGIVGSKVNAEYNGGGMSVKVETISSNIYLRKN